MLSPSEASAAEEANGRPLISVVIPTYREAANMPALVERIDRVRLAHGLRLELIVVDDDSRDGIEEFFRASSHDWIHLIIRKGRRDLSGAVTEGMRQARGDMLVVMDADLSHPPEVLPQLVRGLEDGYDFAIGSRYVPGGSIGGPWSVWRRINSRMATLMARPLTAIQDPMSGFFALRRRTFLRADPLDPVGFKIGLELMTKCRCRKVLEVPICFSERQFGESKLTFRQNLRYVQHLCRLLVYKCFR